MALIEHRRESKCPTCIRPSTYLYHTRDTSRSNHLIPLQPHALIVPSPLDPSFSLSRYVILDCSSVPSHNNYTSNPSSYPPQLIQAFPPQRQWRPRSGACRPRNQRSPSSGFPHPELNATRLTAGELPSPFLSPSNLFIPRRGNQGRTFLTLGSDPSTASRKKRCAPTSWRQGRQAVFGPRPFFIPGVAVRQRPRPSSKPSCDRATNEVPPPLNPPQT